MAKRIVAQHAFSDMKQAETINRLTPSVILEKLKVFYEGVQVSVVEFELGEVLTDSRGRGSFQR